MTNKKGPPDARSAVTGRFVTATYATRHPNTTVVEHRKPSPKPSGTKKK